MMHRTMFLFSLVATLLVGFSPIGLSDEPKKPKLEHTRDTLEDVKKLVDEKKAVLVDVRELVEWKAGHIKGALHVPFRGLQDKVDEKQLKEQFKDKIVYTYCMVGMRSLKAGSILEPFGFDVRPLKPGYEELLKAGFPNEKTEK